VMFDHMQSSDLPVRSLASAGRCRPARSPITLLRS
jgi:hypothetical protein